MFSILPYKILPYNIQIELNLFHDKFHTPFYFPFWYGIKLCHIPIIRDVMALQKAFIHNLNKSLPKNLQKVLEAEVLTGQPKTFAVNPHQLFLREMAS